MGEFEEELYATQRKMVELGERATLLKVKRQLKVAEREKLEQELDLAGVDVNNLEKEKVRLGEEVKLILKDAEEKLLSYEKLITGLEGDDGFDVLG